MFSRGYEVLKELKVLFWSSKMKSLFRARHVGAHGKYQLLRTKEGGSLEPRS